MCTRRYSLYWDETECLNYYGMLSLHEVFHVVGSQLTETDVEVLSFLLDETYEGRHPLDPEGWVSETSDRDPELVPSPSLLQAWRFIQPTGTQCPHLVSRHYPKSGVELLLELERRGYVSEERLEPLLQLLRVLTRHDLLPFVSRKRRKTVSPERHGMEYMRRNESVCSAGAPDIQEQTTSSQESSLQQWRAGVNPSRQSSTSIRLRRGRKRLRVGSVQRTQPENPAQQQATPEKVTCGGLEAQNW